MLSLNDRPIRPQRLLIADWIPSLNKGELAILAGMLKTFEAFTEEVEVSIFSFSLLLDKERYPENVKKIDIVRRQFIGSFHQQTVSAGHIFTAGPTPQPIGPAFCRTGVLRHPPPSLFRCDTSRTSHIGSDAISASVACQQVFSRSLGKTV